MMQKLLVTSDDRANALAFFATPDSFEVGNQLLRFFGDYQGKCSLTPKCPRLV